MAELDTPAHAAARRAKPPPTFDPPLGRPEPPPAPPERTGTGRHRHLHTGRFLPAPDGAPPADVAVLDGGRTDAAAAFRRPPLVAGQQARSPADIARDRA